MKYKLFLTVLSFFVFADLTIAQAKIELASTEKYQFHYDGHFFNHNGLSQVLEKNETAFQAYMKSRRQKRTGLIMGISSIVLGGVSLSVIKIKRDTTPRGLDGFGRNLNLWSFFRDTGMIVLTGMTLMASLIFLNESKENLQKSIKTFNQSQLLNDLGRIPEKPNIQWAQNGIGISIVF